MTQHTSGSGKMVLVLTLITALSGAILAAWDSYTAPKITYHREQALLVAISQVLPVHDSTRTVVLNGQTFYEAFAGDSLVGVGFQALGNGFQGQIRMMLGMTPDLEAITGLEILEQVETPGLGTKIVHDPSQRSDPEWFTNQFNGLLPSPELSVIKNATPTHANEIQAITGATISSQAVVRILNQQIESARQAFRTGSEVVHG